MRLSPGQSASITLVRAYFAPTTYESDNASIRKRADFLLHRE